MALPEVTVRVDESRTRARSTARSFDIRRRSFCERGRRLTVPRSSAFSRMASSFI
jgi:hypothetical protein